MGDLYSDRTPAQFLMTAVVVGLTAIGLLQSRDGSGMRGHSDAAKVTLLSTMLFLLETISLHGVDALIRSEEHTSELQSLMRISYAVFCLKKKKKQESLKQSQLQQRQKKE